MKEGFYMVSYAHGSCPVWLTNINGEMFHYQSFSGKWENVSQERIGKRYEHSPNT